MSIYSGGLRIAGTCHFYFVSVRSVAYSSTITGVGLSLTSAGIAVTGLIGRIQEWMVCPSLFTWQLFNLGGLTVNSRGIRVTGTLSC